MTITANASMPKRQSGRAIQFSARLRLMLFAIFFLAIALQIPPTLKLADAVNQKYNDLIPFDGDTHEYQRLGVNLLYGKGFTDSFLLPFEVYHLDPEYSLLGRESKARYDQSGPDKQATYSFYRAPGLPMLLAAVYRVFGNDPLTARRAMAILDLAIAFILLGLGTYLAGIPGIVAGGMTALYFLNAQPGFENFTTLMTEGPSMFWIALFAVFFAIYTRTKQLRFLALSGLAFTALIFTRSNFIPAFAFIFLYLVFMRAGVKALLVFTAVVVLPAGLWGLNATTTTGKLVLFTTQGEIAFPQFNNMDVLTGTPYTRPGEWNPGFTVDDRGEINYNGKNAPQPGENGWVKGLTFWRDHLDLLPQLFYVKLEANFWYNFGEPFNSWHPERIFLSGIGFLLFALGLRAGNPPRFLSAIPTRAIFLIQLGLIGFLVVVGNTIPLWIILLIWLAIGIMALLFPDGSDDKAFLLKEGIPAWLLTFIASYFFITLLFGEPRFAWPLDPLLLFAGLLGICCTLWTPVAARYGYQ